MEAIVFQVRTVPEFSPKVPKIGSFYPTSVKTEQICAKDRILRRGYVSKTKCCKVKSVSEVENELNKEEEWVEIKKLNGKCKESVGMVELLECLEREAIMGEDKGREPTDYNRRAQIFDKSSKVFQALKETDNSATDLVL